MTKLIVAFRNFANAPKKSVREKEAEERTRNTDHTSYEDTVYIAVVFQPVCRDYSIRVSPGFTYIKKTDYIEPNKKIKILKMRSK
jgi:hypothetical protein